MSLLTDLYQLTMAYALWRAGKHDREAVFHLFTRANPFQSGFTVAAGLESAIEFIDAFGFSPDDLEFIAGLEGNDGRVLFEPGFLDRWAERCAEIIRSEFSVRWVRLTVNKIGAVSDARDVGVIIERGERV